MNDFFYAILIIAGFATVLYFIKTKFEQLNASKQDDQAIKMLQEHLFEIQKGTNELGKTVNEQLGKNNQTLTESLQKQFAATSKMVNEMGERSKNVAEALTKIGETNKQVLGFTEQMRSLENVLKNPKQRGVLGEFFLENMLSNYLAPGQFKMQYGFSNGEIVDAAIFVKDSIIPIDAKFTLENYNRMMETTDENERLALEKSFKTDLKKRIDETSKYVRPEEGTADFAFMFIPADGLFYNLLNQKIGTMEVNSKDLIEYAFSKYVILVSPMTFFAYLQTVLQALNALKIEKDAVEIKKRVGELSNHLNSYQEHMRKLGNHLGTTVNAYNNAGKEFKKIDKDVIRITEGEAKIEVDLPSLERPKAE